MSFAFCAKMSCIGQARKIRNELANMDVWAKCEHNSAQFMF